MIVYARSEDWSSRRETLGRHIAGRIAMYALLVQQREATGGDAAYARRHLAAALGDRDAHLQAPPGTTLVHRRGGDDRIWVVATGGRTVYEGPREGYVAPPPD